MSVDVHFSAHNQVKTKKKKKINVSAHIHFSTQNQVKTKKRSSRHRSLFALKHSKIFRGRMI